MMQNCEIIKILWTGGWDSTYRMVELSRKHVIVQPIYIYGDGRVSEVYERKAMKKIMEQLQSKKETIATILPLKLININEIPQIDKITESYNNIYKNIKLGSQHEWLARYAYENSGIELGTESAPLENSNILQTIHKYGKLIYDENLNTYIVDKENINQDLNYVLGNFRFPIIDKTGKKMLLNIKTWGYEDVMKNVWVCHTPIFGKPCGTCHPCELKIETGMQFLMEDDSLIRYANRFKKPHKYVYNINKRISYYMNKLNLFISQREKSSNSTLK